MMNDDDLSDVLGGVNLDDVDTSERGGFTPLPAGEYMVQIVEGGVVRKDNGDAMMKLVLEVMDGEFTGRKLFENLNIRHSNPTAQKIALETLTELWRDAMGGSGNPPNVEIMTFKPVRAKVAVEKRKDTGDMQNRIKRFFPLNGAPPEQKAAAAPARQATTSAPAGGTRPKPSFLRDRKTA
ncbi:DUF669 domain-containing protein [Xanthobacter versatilis]|uniref:DUF669 domain-containing protein n=1 Tax=Xanthobacter autotrophicus (strain ATCC BAA-1158 / Py2) TaxID=78245 RepID=UPI003726C8E5